MNHTIQHQTEDKTGLHPILIVDDTPSSLKLLAKTLTDAGLEIAVATHGEMALKQAQSQPPELILLDVTMPGVDGFETCKRLKENPLTQDIPVIFMTDLSETVDKVKGLSLGAVDYITKPFEEEEVLVRVRLHLQLGSLSKTLKHRNHQLLVARRKLKTAQKQIIAQEKLAIMGTLVGGVSQELIHPINVVNHSAKNFLELSNALIQELEKQSQQFEESSLNFIKKTIGDIRENAITIYQQGEKAENVIHTLLMQARPHYLPQRIDLNLLLDQVIHLTSKSQQVNHPNFQVEIITSYDQNIGEFYVFPADLSRAFIKLIDHAYQALLIKENLHLKRLNSVTSNFKPQLSIQTKNLNNDVEMRIRDNGFGIPQRVKDKIFNPFFLTKPLGEGTGLGLFLAYNVIVGQHGGTIKVKSEPNLYTEFIITLPKK